LLTRKAHAVQFDIRAFKFFRTKDSRLRPRRSIVARNEYRVSSDQEPCFFVTEIDVVDGGSCFDGLAYPGLAAIVCTTQEPAVAADPASFAVKEVDGVEIVATCTDLVRHPTTLRARRGHKNQPHKDASR